MGALDEEEGSIRSIEFTSIGEEVFDSSCGDARKGLLWYGLGGSIFDAVEEKRVRIENGNWKKDGKYQG